MTLVGPRGDQLVLVVINVGQERATWRLPVMPGLGRWRPLLDAGSSEPPDPAVLAGPTIDLPVNGARILVGVR